MATHAVSAGWDRRRLIYGDWNWLVRDGLDVLRFVFIAGTIVFAAQGRSDAVALGAASAVLLLARVVNLPRWFDFGLIVAMTLIAYGTALGLYGHWFYYDKVVHSLSPMAYSPVIYIALVRLGVVPDPGVAIRERHVARIAGIFIVTLAVGMAVGGFYECIEWLEDKWDILGGHFVKGLWDTETDLLCDAAGSIAGATFITVWALRGWSSHRVTVVPAQGPSVTPLEAVAGRAQDRRAESTARRWRERMKSMPLAAQGLVAVGAGLLLLGLPSPSLRTVGIVLGSALLVTAAIGTFELVRGHTRRGRELDALEVAAAAVAGVLLLAWPAITQRALLFAIGFFSIVLGLLEVASLTEDRPDHDRWLGALAGIAAFVFGLVILGSPGRSLDAIIMLLGLYFVVLGAIRLVQSLAARHGRRRDPA
ncbi:MAG TPA: DUF308 domain-containing protein [Gaiellaceae bacterium]|nr:DUF308 domain-containing protein [Gaiellaceae bacterium]